MNEVRKSICFAKKGSSFQSFGMQSMVRWSIATLITATFLVGCGPSPKSPAEKNALVAAKRLVKNGSELEQQIRFNEALINNYLAVAEYYLKNGIRIPNSALPQMAEAGYVEMIELLIKNGANNLDEALIAGATAGQIKAIEYLLKTGAKGKDRALYFASKSGQNQAVKMLIKHGARPCMQSQDGKTCLYFAVERGNLDLAKELTKAGALNYEDRHSLPLSVKQFNQPMIKLLIESGASAKDVFRDEDGNISFHSSFKNPKMNVEILKLLVKGGFDVNQKDYLGKPLVSVPVDRYILKYLLDEGAIPKTDTEDKRLLEIPFDTITDDEALAWIQILVKAGANFFVNNSYADVHVPDLLFIATKRGFYRTAKYLLDNKIHVFSITLLCAIKAGHQDIAMLMLPYIDNRELCRVFDNIRWVFGDDYGKKPCNRCIVLTNLARICDQNLDIGRIVISKLPVSEKSEMLFGAIRADTKRLVSELLKAGANKRDRLLSACPPDWSKEKSHAASSLDNITILDYAKKYCRDKDILSMLGLNNPAAKAGDLTAEEGLDVTIRVDDGDKTYYALLPFKDETREDYEKRLAEREKIVRDRKKVQNYYISYFDDRVTLDLIRAVKKEINPNYNPETDKEENKFSRK